MMRYAKLLGLNFMGVKYKDLTGQRFGRLLVIKEVGRNKQHNVILWR